MEKSIYSHDYGVFLRLLREARKQAGITQIELAKGIACTQSFVSKCERGERRIDVVELRKFCNALGIDFAEFAARLHDALTHRRRRSS